MKYSILFLALIVVSNTSCLLPKYVAPVKIDPQFSLLKIDKIGMLPMADLRKDTSKPFKHAEYLRKWLLNNLKTRKYAAEFVGKEMITPTVATIEKLSTYDDTFAKHLGDTGYRFVFLPVLSDKASTSFGVGKTATVSIMGIIYDKEQKKVIWLNEAVGEDTGFLGMSLLSNVLAVDNAIGGLMAGMPKSKK